MNEFNQVAPYYSCLKKIVFGNSIELAESFHLKLIKEGDTVLVLGGGTGQILDLLPGHCKVTFLEGSSEMIAIAEKSNKHQNHVEFMHTDFVNANLLNQYDVIISTCFLDVFTNDQIEQAIHHIKSRLSPSGKLIVTDFNKIRGIRWWVLSSAMHLFFRAFAKMRNKSLLPINRILNNSGFKLTKEALFHNKFIFSNIYMHS